MPRIFPFEALVYDPAVAGPLDRVTAPPYDVISGERRRAYQSEPFSIVRIDLARDADGPTGDRYRVAGDLLRDWVAGGALRRLPPALHAYEMATPADGSRVRGLFCAVELEDWGGGILPHERTMPGPLDDRLRLLRATRTHLSPVFGTVAGPCEPLTELLDAVSAASPDAEVRDEQGVIHRRWVLPPDDAAVACLAAEPILIADGHHRYTTALTYRDELRASAGRGPWDRILMLVVDTGSERLPVRPFHRLQLTGEPPAVAGLPARSLADVLGALSDDDPTVGVATRTETGVDLRLAHLAGEPPAVRALHVELLDALAPPDAWRYTPDAEEAVEAVRARTAVAAYLLPPTTPDRIRKVVERGERLPQKSTYFWPKPRTGMLLMPLDEADDPQLRADA